MPLSFSHFCLYTAVDDHAACLGDVWLLNISLNNSILDKTALLSQYYPQKHIAQGEEAQRITSSDTCRNMAQANASALLAGSTVITAVRGSLSWCSLCRLARRVN